MMIPTLELLKEKVNTQRKDWDANEPRTSNQRRREVIREIIHGFLQDEHDNLVEELMEAICREEE